MQLSDLDLPKRTGYAFLEMIHDYPKEDVFDLMTDGCFSCARLKECVSWCPAKVSMQQAKEKGWLSKKANFMSVYYQDFDKAMIFLNFRDALMKKE